MEKKLISAIVLAGQRLNEKSKTELWTLYKN